MKPILSLCAFLFVISSIDAQTLDATISINSSNKLVITINSPASFEFNQTVNAPTGFSIVIDEVYSVDPPALTSTLESGIIPYVSTNGNTGNVIQMGPFGFDYGVYTIRDDEITFPMTSTSFTTGDILTIEPGTIISFSSFSNPPTINPGPYTAFIPSDDYFSIAAPQVEVLPIQMIDFTAKYSGNQVFLSWESASEINNQGFEIENSNNGSDWEIVGYCRGNGTTNTNSKYEFVHKTPKFDTNYYRLKQIDFDGKIDYSKVIYVTYQGNKNLSISPNPTSGIIRFNTTEEGEVKIYDVSGNLLQHLDIIDQEIDISDLPSGILLIHVLTETIDSVYRVVKT